MKRLVSLALAAAFLLLSSAAMAEPSVVQWHTEKITFRKYNNSGVNATRTTPVALDSTYISHAGARLDTTAWIPLGPMLRGYANFSPATLAIDTAFVCRLNFRPPAFAPTVSTSDSFYYALQFTENSTNAIADQNTTVCKGVGVTGSGQWTRALFSLPTCTYKHNEFNGAAAFRLIITWPASTTTSYMEGVVGYNVIPGSE